MGIITKDSSIFVNDLSKPADTDLMKLGDTDCNNDKSRDVFKDRGKAENENIAR